MTKLKKKHSLMGLVKIIKKSLKELEPNKQQNQKVLLVHQGLSNKCSQTKF